jgi:hypothetical protein
MLTHVLLYNEEPEEEEVLKQLKQELEELFIQV